MDPVIAATVRTHDGQTGSELLRVASASNGDVLLDLDGMEIVIDRGELVDALDVTVGDLRQAA